MSYTKNDEGAVIKERMAAQEQEGMYSAFEGHKNINMFKKTICLRGYPWVYLTDNLSLIWFSFLLLME